MPKPEDWAEDPEDVRTAIRFLRALRHWDQKQLAAAAGVDKSRLSLWERGLAPLKETDLRAMAAGARLPFRLFRRLVGIARLFRPLLNDDTGAPPLERTESVLDLARQGAERIAAEIELGLIELYDRQIAERERQDDAEWAARAEPIEALWERLESAPLDLWSFLTTEARDFQTRDFARKLCEESQAAETANPRRARAAALASATAAEAALARETGAADPKAAARRLGESLEALDLSPAQLRQRAMEILGRSAAPASLSKA